MASNRGKRQTYGGLPVSDDYLARHRVMSDQAVFEAIAVGLGSCVVLLGLAAICLWVWA